MVKRFLLRLQILLLLSLVAGGSVHLLSGRLLNQGRDYLVDQLEERGVHAEVGSLGINVLGGVVAREVRIFNDERREQLLVAVDQLTVRFDYGQLFRWKLVVEGLELASADVTLPVTDEVTDGTVLVLRGFSARVILKDGRLRVTQSEGYLEGIALKVSMDLKLGARPESEEERLLAQQQALKRLEMVRNYRGQIEGALERLRRFQFDEPPVFEASVWGETDVPEAFSAEVRFRVGAFQYGGYRCEGVEAEGTYGAGLLDLRKLHLVDALGELEAQVRWRQGEEVLELWVLSSADLREVADEFLQTELLREVVFYDDGPTVSMRGRLFWGQAAAARRLPLEVIGSVEFPQFTSRGEVFEGFTADFRVSEQGWYVRDGLLRHRSGTLGLNVMLEEVQGLRFRVALRMDPTVFKPFLAQDQGRDVLERFEFSRDSSVIVRLEGKREGQDWSALRSEGRAELFDVVHRGVPFERVGARVQWEGGRLVFNEVEAEREDGVAEVDEVELDLRGEWVRLEGLRARCDPVPLVRSFAPNTAEIVNRYRLSSDTLVNVNGVLGWKSGAEKTNLRVGFAVGEGSGRYEVGGRVYDLGQPQGELQFVKKELSFDLRGVLFNGALQAKGRATLAVDEPDYEVDLRAASFEEPLFGQVMRFSEVKGQIRGLGAVVEFESSGRYQGADASFSGKFWPGSGDYDFVVGANSVNWPVFGKELEFEQGMATLSNRDGRVRFECKSVLLGGDFSAEGEVLGRVKPLSYNAEIRVNALSFGRIGKIYTPDYPSEGDLTGHFKFAMQQDNLRSLKGDGVGIIVNGNLYAVPILGPLTSLIGNFLPSPIRGYNVAREANATFRVEAGRLFTDDVEALTSAFRLVAWGNVNLIKDEVEFDAQARLRGLPGIVLRPVSELLEYQARGTLGDPAWKPRLLTLGGRAATEGEADAAPGPAKSGVNGR